MTSRTATSARLDRPTDVVVGTGGVYFIADSCNQRVRRVDASDTMTTVAGSGAVGCDTGGFGGDASGDERGPQPASGVAWSAPTSNRGHRQCRLPR